MKKLLKILFVSVLSIVTASCNKTDSLEEKAPIGKDPTVPAKVNEIKVENKNGRAIISYNVPNDPSLLYVKAVYNLPSGLEHSTQTSYYNGSIEVSGFIDTTEQEVKLYSVSRSQITSEPTIVKVKPLISPIWQTYQSLKLVNAAGGFDLTASNPSKSNVSIMIIGKNKVGDFVADYGRSIFTDLEVVLSKIRGLDAKPQRFGFYVQDRWGNRTDTLYQEMNPIYEVELQKSKFKEYKLPGDPPMWGAVNKAWDERFGWEACFTQQGAGGPLPHTITFNLGTSAKLNRILLRPYPESNPTRYYYLQAMKKFEIYGSSNPNPNGKIDETWSLLGTYEITKPSGLPYGQENSTDASAAVAGFDLPCNPLVGKVQYIRIKCLENWGGGTALAIDELYVYGDPR